MHPAFSVIFFTTLSGLGYGLWIWTALTLLSNRGTDSASAHLVLLVAAVVPVVVGLLSSTLHLGKPLRSWRALSQWRSSWLSREGVLALACFLPWLGLASGVVPGLHLPAAFEPWLLMLLAVGSLATVGCTAMIYASLTPIPAWTHRAVLPVYLGFALLTGGLSCTAAMASVESPGDLRVLALLMLALLLAVGKRRYWRDIDRGALPATRASALGLPADRSATVFERPHTEANYLTTEMGYVLARKHSRRLRKLAVALFAVVPTAACAMTLVFPGLAMALLGLAALSALVGAMVERWLFFAEARHIVTLYY
ncbi:MAG TPA: DmsC/YnfH family molybdoenzyme membrane anchor subunit [Arenimonas sp.]|uniref:dimethyl sulfoxide reductase anchor subunit family protein n=1 Tax=Arenimonas sp. TaxID=1872635 RepID=UPI002D7F3BFA|nr:DmsC/YnfH family molybdoenzyme membrane anchor subunit [Arenimonas sp.]HEU0152672.1 DmsC/YnfH family molybdoenzyme membrane anchor subunit [Arenimonas sp.]